jgi:hypothetical protein
MGGLQQPAASESPIRKRKPRAVECRERFAEIFVILGINSSKFRNDTMMTGMFVPGVVDTYPKRKDSDDNVGYLENIIWVSLCNYLISSDLLPRGIYSKQAEKGKLGTTHTV